MVILIVIEYSTDIKSLVLTSNFFFNIYITYLAILLM